MGNEPKQLQFIGTMDENTLCDNCHQSYSSIFKCDLCSMSICSKCQKYIAEMQCLRSVMKHFKYAKDFKIEQQNEINHKLTLYNMLSPSLEYEYDSVPKNNYDNNLDGKLQKLLTQLHFKASDKLEYIFEEDLLHITIDKIDHEMCYDILDYLDDVDLCCIINSKSSVELLEIYWELYQYHITYHCREWKKLRLLCSTKWENNNLITIKQLI